MLSEIHWPIEEEVIDAPFPLPEFPFFRNGEVSRVRPLGHLRQRKVKRDPVI